MKTLGHILIVDLCLSIVLTACSSATPASTPVLPSPSPLPKPTSPQATLAPTPELVSVGVPVIEYSNDGLNKLLVISSVTGKVFDALPPIQLGQNVAGDAFAPDGLTLALVSAGQLYLIDLPSWKYRTFDIGLHGGLSAVLYSPDGTLLALASGLSDGGLRIVDVKSGEVKASAQAGFAIRNVKFTTDGKAIMVYGPHLASTGIAANAGVSVGAPRAALFSVSDLNLLWSAELTGIRDGVFPKKADTANTQDIYQPGAAWYFGPGIAFAPKQDILYVVHGDEDKLTTVDFARQKVSTVDVHVKTSWLDQLLALTAGVAYAKGMDGTTKQAVISPDGKFLFASGNTEAVTQQANGTNWDITDAPIVLQVIATEDGTLVAQMDTEANSVTLSPEGRQVFLTGWKRNNYYATPWTDVYDISSRSIIKHLNNIYLIPTHRLDGKTILASSHIISNMNYMVVIDPDTWVITGEWKGMVDWLIAR